MIRTRMIVGVLLLTAASASAAQHHPVEDPSMRYRQRADSASPGDCARVCFEAATQVAEASNRKFSEGDVETAQKWMKDAVEYARKGTEASIQTHKRQKEAEIQLRKLSKRIHDIGDSLSLDDRPPVYEESKAVDRLRDQMLTAMFGTPKKTLEDKQ